MRTEQRGAAHAANTQRARAVYIQTIISIFTANHHKAMITHQFAASRVLFIFFKRTPNSIMRWDWSHERRFVLTDDKTMLWSSFVRTYKIQESQTFIAIELIKENKFI